MLTPLILSAFLSMADPPGPPSQLLQDNEASAQCSPRTTPRCAELDLTFVERLRAHTTVGTPFVVRSTGGFSPTALMAASVAIDQEMEAVVVDFCISSCLELLLPGFERISARGAPLSLRMATQIHFFN